MFSFLPAPIRGGIAFLLLVINTLFWCIPLLALALLKLILPIPAWRAAISKGLIWVAQNWISGNGVTASLLHKYQWDIQEVADLSRKNWYLVVSNHQSWVDIFVLQSAFNRRIPFLKFFIKQELIWIPVIGLAWWALDFPFIKRYSKEYLRKHPKKRGKDLETTRKACEKFQTMPISVMNFMEGTRFSMKKHGRQQSPYQHLLRPKAGGIALVLDAMGDIIQTMLNVTIIYPNGSPTFWDYLSGRAQNVIVRVEQSPISAHLAQGDYMNDPEFKVEFQDWVNTLWQEKDALINKTVESGD
ncbi:MAG: acyltransferase [Chloroflexi bacterium]|nr:acyltransferase [Chloroflexota bacterium]